MVMFSAIFIPVHLENMKTKCGALTLIFPCDLPLGNHWVTSDHTGALWVTGVVVVELKMCTEKILKQLSVNKKCK